MIDELAESPSVTEANKLLNQGWVLIKSAELLQVDDQGHQITTITYILGHVKEKGRRSGAVKPRDTDGAPSSALQQVDGGTKAALPRRKSTESTTSSSNLPPLRTYFPYPYSGDRRRISIQTSTTPSYSAWMVS